MVDEGHEIAVHSGDHRSHRLRVASTSGQLERPAELLEHVSGTRPTLIRPPYGMLTGADVLAARRVGLRPLLRTSWAKDWTAAGALPACSAR